MNNFYWRFINKFRKIFNLTEISQKRIQRYLKNRRPGFVRQVKESLTVIVPCFKHAKFIVDCFESIKNQTRKPDEIIFVNDCSPDYTKVVIEKIINENKDFSIKLINNIANIGQAESINIAVKESQSEYIMILNDDDYLFKNTVEIILNTFKNNKDIFLIGGGCISLPIEKILDKNILVSNSNFIMHVPENVRLYQNYNDLNMTHSSMTFKKHIFESVGGYYKDKKKRLVFFSDRDFQLRVGLLYPVGIFISPIVYWRSNTSVDSGLNS